MSPTDIRIPGRNELPESPQRIICHWTAGSHRSSMHDRAHYHYLIEHLEGDPQTPEDDRIRLRQGVPLERNMRRLSSSDPSYATDPETGYAAHTRGFNSHSIGVALCGMRGAVDHRPGRPVDPGPSPITRMQVKALLNLLRQLCATYYLSPTEGQLFHHWEADHLHGVDQPGKWDVTWLPGLQVAKGDTGPWIRRQVGRAMDGKQIDY